MRNVLVEVTKQIHIELRILYHARYNAASLAPCSSFARHTS